MRSQESNYMYSSFTKSTIKNQNTQLTEKSVGITIRISPDYPIEKSQYPINKKIGGYYPIHQNFLSGALNKPLNNIFWCCILIPEILKKSYNFKTVGYKISVTKAAECFIFTFYSHYKLKLIN